MSSPFVGLSFSLHPVQPPPVHGSGSRTDAAADSDHAPPTLAELDTPTRRNGGRSQARTGRAATVTATTPNGPVHDSRPRVERAATVTATTADADSDSDNSRSPSPTESDQRRASDASGTSEDSQHSEASTHAASAQPAHPLNDVVPPALSLSFSSRSSRSSSIHSLLPSPENLIDFHFEPVVPTPPCVPSPEPGHAHTPSTSSPAPSPVGGSTATSSPLEVVKVSDDKRRVTFAQTGGVLADRCIPPNSIAYWEVLLLGVSNTFIGIARKSEVDLADNGGRGKSVSLRMYGDSFFFDVFPPPLQKWRHGVPHAYGPPNVKIAPGDRVGVLVGTLFGRVTLEFFVNGRSIGVAFDNLEDTEAEAAAPKKDMSTQTGGCGSETPMENADGEESSGGPSGESNVFHAAVDPPRRVPEPYYPYIGGGYGTDCCLIFGVSPGGSRTYGVASGAETLPVDLARHISASNLSSDDVVKRDAEAIMKAAVDAEANMEAASVDTEADGSTRHNVSFNIESNGNGNEASRSGGRRTEFSSSTSSGVSHVGIGGDGERPQPQPFASSSSPADHRHPADHRLHIHSHDRARDGAAPPPAFRQVVQSPRKLRSDQLLRAGLSAVSPEMQVRS